MHDIALGERCNVERLESSGDKDSDNLLIIGGSKRIYNPQRTGKEGRFVKNKRRHHVVVALNMDSTIKFEKDPEDILKATVRYFDARSRRWVEVEALPPPDENSPKGEVDAKIDGKGEDKADDDDDDREDTQRPTLYFWLEHPKGKKLELRFHFKHSDFFASKLFIFVKVFNKDKPNTEYVCFPIQKKLRKVCDPGLVSRLRSVVWRSKKSDFLLAVFQISH